MRQALINENSDLCAQYPRYVMRITGNDKEGICIDYGTLGAYIRGNRIAGNGARSRQTDDDLRNDFVHHLGRMRDGSSNAKLPGLSIDNAACNIIHENTVTGNFGTLLGYLQTLQRVPGDLHWNRLQLSAAGYPQASIQLTLYTLSNRPDTPFN